jgi:hypothetical protein
MGTAASGNPNGRKGAPNKNKKFLLNRLQDMYGDDFHPIMQMAENCVLLQNIVKSDPEPNNIKIAIDAWDKVAAYTEPKLKAVEVSGDIDNPLALEHKITFIDGLADGSESV